MDARRPAGGATAELRYASPTPGAEGLSDRLPVLRAGGGRPAAASLPGAPQPISRTDITHLPRRGTRRAAAALTRGPSSRRTATSQLPDSVNWVWM